MELLRTWFSIRTVWSMCTVTPIRPGLTRLIRRFQNGARKRSPITCSHAEFRKRESAGRDLAKPCQSRAMIQRRVAQPIAAWRSRSSRSMSRTYARRNPNRVTKLTALETSKGPALGLALCSWSKLSCAISQSLDRFAVNPWGAHQNAERPRITFVVA